MRFTSSFFSSLEGFSLRGKRKSLFQQMSEVSRNLGGLKEEPEERAKTPPPPSLYLAGLLALHDPEDGVFESVVDKRRRRGFHVLLHQRAGERGRSEQRRRLVWLRCDGRNASVSNLGRRKPPGDVEIHSCVFCYLPC